MSFQVFESYIATIMFYIFDVVKYIKHNGQFLGFYSDVSYWDSTDIGQLRFKFFNGIISQHFLKILLISFNLKKGKILNIPFAHVRKCLSTSMFFIFRLSNVLPVNTSLSLSCPPVCSIYSLLQLLQIITYIRLGVSQLKLDFKILVIASS